MNKTPDEIKKLLECPWCGEQMRFDGDSVHVWYKCDNCWANSPKARRLWDDGKSNKENWDINKDNALFLIRKSEVKTHRWISVKERLPEDGAYVLVHVKHPENSGLEPWSCIMADTWYQGGWDINADSTVHEVTHWMPLPEPPKA